MISKVLQYLKEYKTKNLKPVTKLYQLIWKQ